MDIVVHEYVGLQGASGVEQRCAKQVQVAVPVCIIQQAGQAVVAAPDDMLGDTGKVESGLRGHARRVTQDLGVGVPDLAATCRRCGVQRTA